MSTYKKVNRYFESISIKDSSEANILGSQTNWEILEALADVGSRGFTAKELMNQLGLSKNTVHNALKILKGADFVLSQRPQKRPGPKSQQDKIRFSPKKDVELSSKKDDEAITDFERDELDGTATRIYVHDVPWRPEVDEDFKEIIKPIIEKAVSDLKDKYRNIIFEAMDEVWAKENGKFFPKNDNLPCKECGVTHESVECVEAISYFLHMKLSRSIRDELSQKYNFGHPKPIKLAT